MAEKITYGVVGVGTYAIIASLFGYPFSYFAFVAGVISVLIEIEDYGYPTHPQSPLTHSLFFAAIWIAASHILLNIAGFPDATQLTMALFSAFSSHFLLDSMTKQGIFAFPSSMDIKRWLKPLPPGSERAWESWLIVPKEQWRVNKAREGSDPILNLGSMILSMVIIIVALL